jgi:hypothetical protein
VKKYAIASFTGKMGSGFYFKILIAATISLISVTGYSQNSLPSQLLGKWSERKAGMGMPHLTTSITFNPDGTFDEPAVEYHNTGCWKYDAHSSILYFRSNVSTPIGQPPPPEATQCQNPDLNAGFQAVFSSSPILSLET